MSADVRPYAEPLGAVGSSLFEASDDCVKLIGLDGTLQAMNAQGVCLLELDSFESVRGISWASLWPETEREKIAAAVEHACQGRVARFAADSPTAKGVPKSWEVVVTPVYDEAGHTVRLISISRDITKFVRVQEENALLAHELAHRIKNMFAVVDGVISMSARKAPEESRRFATALRDRLTGLGRALAYVAPPAAGYAPDAGQLTLQGLLHVLLHPYGDVEGADRRIVVTGDDEAIGKSATTSIALLINELATNALKYGSLSSPDGHVAVRVVRTAAATELVWQELGVGLTGPRTMSPTEGFGTTLMDNAVSRQLGGRLFREWGPEGLVVHVHLPLERLAR